MPASRLLGIGLVLVMSHTGMEMRIALGLTTNGE
jgi:hypothetical protein